ncbi:hypothetical protein HanHA89_Chr13g0500751 [Helianthus annuus]|nr:hypothetical protein HanHA89_Chr13g0500751 [Helianthus annuus]
MGQMVMAMIGVMKMLNTNVRAKGTGGYGDDWWRWMWVSVLR